MPRKKTQEQVIQEFKAVHGEIYDYSRVVHNGITAYKIGITNNDVNTRYSSVD